MNSLKRAATSCALAFKNIKEIERLRSSWTIGNRGYGNWEDNNFLLSPEEARDTEQYMLKCYSNYLLKERSVEINSKTVFNSVIHREINYT